jgi:hypothetical protein
MFTKANILKLLSLPCVWRKRWASLKSAFIAMPTVLLVFADYSFVDKANQQIQGSIKLFIEKNLFISIALIFAPIMLTILFEVIEYISERIHFHNNLPNSSYERVVDSINHIVGNKSERFSKFLEKVKGTKPTPEMVFKAITDPNDQINQILFQIYAIFRMLLDVSELTVVLVKVENEKAMEYVKYMPSDNSPSLDLKTNKVNFFNYVAKSKSIQVISDINEKYNKPVKNNSMPYAKSYGSKEGSIIGIPIFDYKNQTVRYVITVKSNDAKVFTKSSVDKYKKIIQTYSKRIALETVLSDIKGVTV